MVLCGSLFFWVNIGGSLLILVVVSVSCCLLVVVTGYCIFCGFCASFGCWGLLLVVGDSCGCWWLLAIFVMVVDGFLGV